MSLPEEPPPPPTLEAVDPSSYEDATVSADTDYHREELEAFLAGGAWAEAYDRWAAEGAVDPGAFEIATDLELFAEFDFFWDDVADRVGYHAPGIPEDWKQRDLHPALDSWETVSTINAGLTEFGQLICDVLEEEYIDWESDYEAPEDLPDF